MWATSFHDGHDPADLAQYRAAVPLAVVLESAADTGTRALLGSETLQLLHQALDRLSERDQRIVTMRFGLGGRREQTQKEVADSMGISQSYISRLEKRIMVRLRRDILRQTTV